MVISHDPTSVRRIVDKVVSALAIKVLRHFRLKLSLIVVEGCRQLSRRVIKVERHGRHDIYTGRRSVKRIGEPENASDGIRASNPSCIKSLEVSKGGTRIWVS